MSQLAESKGIILSSRNYKEKDKLVKIFTESAGKMMYDPHLFHFTQLALNRMDQGDDAEIITNIFEVQLLQRFGIAPIWTHCVVCGETQGKFDYSSKYGGVICEKHWGMDHHRYHADPRAVYFVRMFSAISYDKINGISLKEETLKKRINQLPKMKKMSRIFKEGSKLFDKRAVYRLLLKLDE